MSLTTVPDQIIRRKRTQGWPHGSATEDEGHGRVTPPLSWKSAKFSELNSSYDLVLILLWVPDG